LFYCFILYLKSFPCVSAFFFEAGSKSLRGSLFSALSQRVREENLSQLAGSLFQNAAFDASDTFSFHPPRFPQILIFSGLNTRGKTAF